MSHRGVIPDSDPFGSQGHGDSSIEHRAFLLMPTRGSNPRPPIQASCPLTADPFLPSMLFLQGRTQRTQPSVTGFPEWNADFLFDVFELAGDVHIAVYGSAIRNTWCVGRIIIPLCELLTFPHGVCPRRRKHGVPEGWEAWALGCHCRSRGVLKGRDFFFSVKDTPVPKARGAGGLNRTPTPGVHPTGADRCGCE